MAALWQRPFVVECAALRSRLLACGAAGSLASLVGPGSVVAKRSTVAGGGVFSYSEDDRDAARRDVGAERFAVSFEEVSAETLVAACEAQARSGDRWYYTAPLRASDDGGWDGVVGAGRSEPRRSSLWVGGCGSTTQAHYDVADNVLAQVVGRKRVRLWHPDQHFSLHVFPDAHPRARKAQVDVDAPGLGDARYPLAAGLGPPALDVVLEAGDAVAIPAFWFHHCEALDGGCSVNAFFPSRTAAAAADVLRSPMPPSATLRDAIDEAFCDRVYESRYAPLAGAYAALASDAPARVAARPPVVAASAEAAADDRERALGALRRTAGDDAAMAIGDIAVAHLLELWAVGLAGDAARVGPMLLGSDPGVR